MNEEKVTFGLSNVYYATFTVTAGVITFDKPIPIPGAVEMTNDPVGDPIKFYADNMVYYQADNNQGYEGKLSIARVPDSFRKDVLGEELGDTDGIITEYADAKTKPFALLFQFENDIKARRHVIYNNNAQRPSVSSSAKKDSTDPNVVELSYNAAPVMMNGRPIVKASTTEATPASVYDNWFDAVYDKLSVTVTVTPETATVAPGGTQQLTASVANATDTSVTWSSSDQTVATVDANGLVTVDPAATTGETATITASSVADPTSKDTAVITVS